MPSHNRSRCNQNERLLPSRPDSSQGNPEQLVHGRQSATRSFCVQSQQLLAESQVLEDEILTGTEEVKNPPNEMTKG